MLRRILLAAALWCSLAAPAWDASRFWNPYSVTGAVSGTGGVCRLTISPAITGSGLLAGNTISVTSIGGATECNGTTTISTVVDSTHIELAGTTFSLVYTTGGCVGGGNVTSTNTSNWAASSTATCGSGGQTVPGSADTATWDANSLAGTVTLNFGGTWTLQSLTMGAFTGTFDNSVNNNNITLTNNTGNVFNISGSGARTIKLGTATYTLSGTSAVFSAGTTTNLTYTGNTNSNIVFSGTGTGTRQFNSGSISHGNVTFGASSSGGGFSVSLTSATVNSLAISGPNQLQIVGGLAITNAFSWVGSSSNPIGIGSASPATAVSFTNAASSTAQWVVFYNCQFTNSPIATNSLDLGGNSGITITPPQAIGAGGGTLIGG